MTCIVGIEYNGDMVLLGGDIQGTGHNNKVVHTQPKVFNKKGIVFGFTTSYRFGQILEHNLPDPVVPNDTGDIYRWLITALIPDIRRTLHENGYDGGGSCLIGIKNQLWELQPDFSVLRSVNGYCAVGSGYGVLRSVNGYCAVGSGYEYAMGSLHTVMTSNRPVTFEGYRDALKQAIAVAGTFSPSVGVDSVIIST